MIYRYGTCKRCYGCGQISVFRPRSGDPEPCREVPCGSCEGTGVVPVGVLSAEELSARISALQRHSRDLGQEGTSRNAVPSVQVSEELLRDHALHAE